jgi:hypothetical protein
MQAISFCIQGPVAFGLDGSNQTLNLLASIRRFFPGSPVVFSTWVGQPVEGFEDCKLVVSPDPGSGLRIAGDSQQNNINRQILSTRAGLAEVQTEYAVKLRSDLLFHKGVLAVVLARLPETPGGNLTFFERYVLVLDRLTFDPRKKANPVLHVTDHFQAGLTADIKAYWSQPFMSEAEEGWFLKDPSMSSGYFPRFRAEQYFWKNLVASHTSFELESSETAENELPWSTVDTFKNNLIPLKFPSIGLTIQKAAHHWTWKDSWVSSTYAYTYLDWLKDNPGRYRSIGLPLSSLYWEYRGEVLRRLGGNAALRRSRR